MHYIAFILCCHDFKSLSGAPSSGVDRCQHYLMAAHFIAVKCSFVRNAGHEKVTQSSNLSNDNTVNNYIVSIPFVPGSKNNK